MGDLICLEKPGNNFLGVNYFSISNKTQAKILKECIYR